MWVLPFLGSDGSHPPCVSPRMSRMMSSGSTPRIRVTTCSRYEGKMWSWARAARAEPTCAASCPKDGGHRANCPWRCRFVACTSKARIETMSR